MQIFEKSILLILFLAVLGCAAGAQRQLLQVDDWRTMPDDELLSYYFALNEEIDRCEARRPRGAIGLGTGIGTGSTRFGVGITQGVTGCNTERLRERRAIVRSELRSRGLIQ
jgi:F0F1-type ATP synthase membrane subunit c/vacuolar-type H+-ATPase subunit K